MTIWFICFTSSFSSSSCASAYLRIDLATPSLWTSFSFFGILAARSLSSICIFVFLAFASTCYCSFYSLSSFLFSMACSLVMTCVDLLILSISDFEMTTPSTLTPCSVSCLIFLISAYESIVAVPFFASLFPKRWLKLTKESLVDIRSFRYLRSLWSDWSFHTLKDNLKLTMMK